jgi:hypothetical protein
MLLALAALALVTVAASGCGQTEKEKYVDDYKPLNDRLLKVGQEIGTAPLAARRQSNVKISQQFDKYASDLDDVRKDIASLDTPDSLKPESKSLTSAIGLAVTDLRDISGAAKRADKRAAAGATLELRDHAEKVNFSQNRLATATGADVGPR